MSLRFCHFDHNVFWYGPPCVNLLCSLWFLGPLFVSFPRLGNVQYYLSNFLAPSLSSPSGVPIKWMRLCLMMLHRSFSLFSLYYYSFFSFFSSAQLLSITQPSRLLILSSAFSNLLFIHSKHIFSFIESFTSAWSFKYFLCLCWGTSWVHLLLKSSEYF